MKKLNYIPDLPHHKIAIVDVQSKPSGYLSVSGYKVHVEYDEGGSGEKLIDAVSRNNLDAVGIVAYEREDGDAYVQLVSCIRPALLSRAYASTKRSPHCNPALQWEIPAGIVERNEVGLDGVLRTSARELREEVGFETRSSQHKMFGNGEFGSFFFPSVGISGERIYMTHVDVTGMEPKKRTGDGTVLERGSVPVMVSLRVLLKAIEKGKIVDGKTIIGAMWLRNMLEEEGFWETS